MADKGTYQCYVSTNQGNNEAHVNVEVKAPIRSLSLLYNSVTEELTCSSRDIYPEPSLRWTASHDDAAPTQNDTQLNKEGLYSVTSTLRIPHDQNATEQYICTIVSSGDQTWEGSWKKQESIQSLETQTAVIPCSIIENHQEFTLIWSVMRDGTLSTVVEYQSSTKTSQNSLDNARVDEERINTGDGSLILQNLRSSNEGTYICKYTASGVIHFIQTDLNIALVCRYSEACTLPCYFTRGSGIVIHWQKIPGNTIVHSFYHEQDQLGTQNEQYQGRTSIFKEELDNGNASLLLRDIRMADKGTYHCYVSTDQRKNEAHVTVEVKAPIRSLSLVYNSMTQELTCSSCDIYPAPTLRWTASHDDAAPTQNDTQLNKEGLYSVTSTLRIPHDQNATEQYICTIVSSGDQAWEGSWKKQESIQSLETQTAVIPCNISENHQEFTLIWSVMRDGTLSTVVEYQSSTKTSLNSLDNARVDEERINTGDGSLILQNLLSSNEGTYTCKYTASGVTHFIQTDLNIDDIEGSPFSPELFQHGGAGLINLYPTKRRRVSRALYTTGELL
ncbi:UNVERIFIED_CONTAM: hypothetical protein FKN15_009824 [Acipenser sinensis]